MLDKACQSHPNSWWWIKADACDVVSGLGMSVSGKWSGDANLNTEELETLYREHTDRLEFLKSIGLGDREESLMTNLVEVKQSIQVDIGFIDSSMLISNKLLCPTLIICTCIIGLRKYNQEYEEKVVQEKRDKKMFELAWDVKELSDLNDIGRKLLVECTVLSGKLEDPEYNKVTDNFAHQLNTFQESMVCYVQRVVKYKRIAATHVMAVLISPEERSSKPYALAVQCIAYAKIKDKEVRNICNRVVKEMTVRGMKVAGRFTF